MLRALRRPFGVVALLYGAALVGWLGYNLYSPTPAFTQSAHPAMEGMGLLAQAWLLLSVGWCWVKSRPVK